MVGEKDKKNVLSPKDNALFKNVVKFYTAKQYKKGLKAADSILKSNPEHGETLSMKGLIFNCQEKKAEAYDYVRRGLRADLTSHVCWHAYGLVYRSDRNYPEAIKCYLNALRWDKDSIQILRDLSLLQIQTRDLQGYHNTRRQILTLKPGQENNWIAFGMSAHLMGNYDEAKLILDQYTDHIKKPPEGGSQEGRFEQGELLLYKNLVIEESGNYSEALSHIQAIEAQVVDKIAWKEKRASLYLLTNNFTTAEEEYRALIHLNPENQSYHRGLIAAKLCVGPSSGYSASDADRYEQLCHNLTQEQQATLETLYSDVAKDHPRSLMARRIPLEFLQEDKFKSALLAYLAPNLRKGVPSLFTGLKALYNNDSKRKAISQIVDDAVRLLTDSNTFPCGADGKQSAEVEPPSTLLWTLFFAAQHNDKINKHADALALVERAIAHTPTAIELYMLKAKILKHAGDPLSAWKAYESARELDLADRYLNTKSTLYALRADQVEAAERTIALFTKEGADSQDVLFDMQCMWYETEAAASYLRTQNYGRALKKLTAVDKHFGDILEDQYDFHTYCLRKMTLRSYLALLRLEDRLYSLRFYRIAAKAIVNTYLNIHDYPQSASSKDEGSTLSSKDRKKLKLQAKKAAAREQAAGGSSGKTKDAAASTKPVDEDPHGEKLAGVADPLSEAQKYIRVLLKYAPNDVEVHLLSSKVNLRRKKYLQVVKALNNGARLAPDHAELQQQRIELGIAVGALTDNDVVTSVLREEVARLLVNVSPERAAEQLVGALGSRSYAHRTAAVASLVKLNKQEDALVLAQDVRALGGATLSEAATMHRFISRVFGSEQAEKDRMAGHSSFPLASIFAPIPPPNQPASTPDEDNL